MASLPLTARVVNGRIVVDEPTDLPEGTAVGVVVIFLLSEGSDGRTIVPLEQRLDAALVGCDVDLVLSARP